MGERWRVGSALLEVSEPRFPCFKLGLRMGDPTFLKRFAAARRTGTYLRIVEEGEIGAGDPIERGERPDHGVTIGLFAEAYLGDHSLAPRSARGAAGVGGVEALGARTRNSCRRLTSSCSAIELSGARAGQTRRQ